MSINNTFVGALEAMKDMGPLRAYLGQTPADAWNLNTVRSHDGTKNCFFGHLYNFGAQQILDAGGTEAESEKYANHLWAAFEESWATSYKIYAINDGENPKYQQATARGRVLAYLDALAAGTEMTTYQSMDACFAMGETEPVGG